MRSLLLVLALVACKRDDPGGNGTFGALPDPKVTILEEGSGPENSAPLEPAIAGYRASSQSRYVRWAGAIDAGRDDVIAEETMGRYQTGLYRQTDDGLVLHALDRPLDDTSRPALLVPSAVRLGMRWESDLGEGVFDRAVAKSPASLSDDSLGSEAFARSHQRSTATRAARMST